MERMRPDNNDQKPEARRPLTPPRPFSFRAAAERAPRDAPVLAPLTTSTFLPSFQKWNAGTERTPSRFISDEASGHESPITCGEGRARRGDDDAHALLVVAVVLRMVAGAPSGRSSDTAIARSAHPPPPNARREQTARGGWVARCGTTWTEGSKRRCHWSTTRATTTATTQTTTFPIHV